MMEKGKTHFKGKLLHLMTRWVTLPNGYSLRIELIKHPGAALIVPFLTNGKVILLRQFRPAVNSYLYELPAGTLSKNERPLACARREIVEETGYAASRFTLLGALHPVPGYSTEKITVYKAEKLTPKKRNAEKDEVIEGHIVTRPEVRRLFKGGRITDAKTICAFTMCGWL